MRKSLIAANVAIAIVSVDNIAGEPIEKALFNGKEITVLEVFVASAALCACIYEHVRLHQTARRQGTSPQPF